ncbi:MAG: hypothetical protein GY702_20160 [Desulfobulbaceae bacterium]|nr:hypothetical protein [Desulfobulbaceae bacterium]
MFKQSVIGILSLILVFSFTGTGFSEDLTPKLCKEKALAAAELIKAEGDAALQKIKDKNGEFRFADGAGYVWVHNLEGVMVMHPIKPSLDGKELLDLADTNGTLLFMAMNEIAEDKGSGWVPYVWPKPGEKDSSPKVSYVVLVNHGGKEYVAGAGIYDVTADDIKKKFPNDPIWEDN